MLFGFKNLHFLLQLLSIGGMPEHDMCESAEYNGSFLRLWHGAV
jgi:hypothetical protein